MSRFREFPTRMLGHGMAIALAFQSPEDAGIAAVCDILGCGYIITHAAYNGYRMRSTHSREVVLTTFDTLVFDTFASALIPAGITTGICILCEMVLTPRLPDGNAIIRYAPAGLSLLFLCVTYDSIDYHVSRLMTKTIRKFYS